MKLQFGILFLLITSVVSGQNKPVWEVNSLNTGKGFSDVQMLSDGGILSLLTYCTSRTELPDSFYDAKNNSIPFDNQYDYDHQLINQKTLVKFSKDGVYEWSISYNNKSYYSDIENEIECIAYKIINRSQIVVLVKFTEAYFQKLDDEEKKQESLLYVEDEEYEGDYNESNQDNENIETEESEVEVSEEEEFEKDDFIDRSVYGLQFIDPSSGNIESVMLLEDLNSLNTEIYNIENSGKNVIVIAGRTYNTLIRKSDSLLVENAEKEGNFVAAINIVSGEILWYDIISHLTQDGFYIGEPMPYSYLSVADDGTIYYCSQHYGDVLFSNHEHIQTEYKDKQGLNCSAYLISYTKNGKINWTKSNTNRSYPHSIKACSSGIYIAQFSYGNQSFDLQTDTIGQKYICVSFLNTKGKEVWNMNLPNSKIKSIQIESKKQILIQGVYNGISLRTFMFDINSKQSLNVKHDFFILKVDVRGNINSIFSQRLWIQDHLYSIGTTFNLIDADYAVMSYHTQKYFTREEREKQGISTQDLNAHADLCKLVKIDLNTLKFD